MINIKSSELINIDKNINNAVEIAANLFKEGKIFIYPTDTIYGFGANPFDEFAVERLNEIKGRSDDKKYILLHDSFQSVLKYVEIISEKHYDFLMSIWPNPISVILNLNSKTSKLLNSKNAAFRIPHHSFCQKLTRNIQTPLISSSVNRSGNPPLNEYSLINAEFNNDVDVIFYSEKKTFVAASTIIDLTDDEPKLIREGKISYNDILKNF